MPRRGGRDAGGEAARTSSCNARDGNTRKKNVHATSPKGADRTKGQGGVLAARGRRGMKLCGRGARRRGATQAYMPNDFGGRGEACGQLERCGCARQLWRGGGAKAARGCGLPQQQLPSLLPTLPAVAVPRCTCVYRLPAAAAAACDGCAWRSRWQGTKVSLGRRDSQPRRRSSIGRPNDRSPPQPSDGAS